MTITYIQVLVRSGQYSLSGAILASRLEAKERNLAKIKPCSNVMYYPERRLCFVHLYTCVYTSLWLQPIKKLSIMRFYGEKRVRNKLV